MNEAARQQMLSAIGIMPLVPRFVLAGAAPSPQCDSYGLDAFTPELTPPVATPQAQRAAVQVDVAPRANNAPRVEGAARADNTPRAKAPRIDVEANAAPTRQPTAASAKSGANSEAAAPRLQVNLIQHHARCFSLLPAYKPEFQAEADQFLRAVMLALGVASAPLSTQLFRWPFANNAKLDLGPAALREALGGFVVHAAREPNSVVLLWGLDVARHLQDDAITKPCEFALSATLRGIAVHRVQDYFNEPLRKRDLWRQLAPLKSVFKAGAA